MQHNEFENMPNDVLRTIALELKPVDLISLCSTNNKFKTVICEDRSFWYRKLLKDYPEYARFQQLKNPKNTYIRKFTEIITIIEKITKNNDPSNTERYYKAYTEYHLSNRYGLNPIVEKYNLNRHLFEEINIKINRVMSI